MSAAQELLVLRHGPLVGPATLVDVLDGRASQLPWREVDLDGGAALPDLTGTAGVLCLGGVMDVDDDEPWLAPERDLLAAAVDAGVPVLGVCLGAQQLAVALGGEVAELPSAHDDVVGLSPTAAGREDPVSAGWPDGGLALFHHRDGVVRLPDGAVPLLGGTERTIAGWRDASGVAHAVQFHPEADLATVQAWEERAAGGPLDVEEHPLLRRMAAAAPFVRAAGAALVARWLDVAVLPRTR